MVLQRAAPGRGGKQIAAPLREARRSTFPFVPTFLKCALAASSLVPGEIIASPRNPTQGGK